MRQDVFGLGTHVGLGLVSPFKDFPWIRDAFARAGTDIGRQGPARFAYSVALMLQNKDLQATVRADPTMLDPAYALRPDSDWWLHTTPTRKKIHDLAVAKGKTLPQFVHESFDPIGAISKIPVLGPVIKAAASPITSVAALAQGERLDHVLADNFKAQVGAIKAVGPYAATVISFVPGVGTGVAAALAAGTALAEGKPIDQAIEEGIRGAIPGGAIAQAGFDLARKVASGENVGKAALETARAQLPPAAQKAFDVGLAVVSGKQLQSALVSAVSSLAPNEVKQILDVGAHMIQTTPGLSNLASSLSSDAARQGLQLASGALAHAGINEAAIRTMRSKLTGDVLRGFDAALKSQIQHVPWLSNVVEPSAASTAPSQAVQDLQALAQLTPEQQKQLIDMQELAKLTPEQQKQLTAYAQASKTSKPPEPAKTAPKPTEPTHTTPKPPEPTRAAPATAPKVTAAKPPEPTRAAPVAAAASGVRYPPYPKMAGAVHGAPGALGGPAPHCAVWGAPVPMDRKMMQAAHSALVSSRGRPAVARAPGGTLYMFTAEDGVITARPCVSRA